MEDLILHEEKPEPDPLLRQLCYEKHLSIIPDTGGRYRCGPVDYKTGRFAWYVLEDTPLHALASALETMADMIERRAA